jgi:hypothetical protein
MKALPATVRRGALWGALALSLAATAWVAREDESTAPAVAAVAPRHAPAADAPPAASHPRGDWPAVEPLAAAAWGSAPAPAAPPVATAPPAEAEAAPPPPLPAAPPFPYRLVGRLSDAATRAILDGPQRSAVVAVGDIVDGQWRVDAIDATGLRLTYLPLGQAQHIPFAAA